MSFDLSKPLYRHLTPGEAFWTSRRAYFYTASQFFAGLVLLGIVSLFAAFMNHTILDHFRVALERRFGYPVGAVLMMLMFPLPIVVPAVAAAVCLRCSVRRLTDLVVLFPKRGGIVEAHLDAISFLEPKDAAEASQLFCRTFFRARNALRRHYRSLSCDENVQNVQISLFGNLCDESLMKQAGFIPQAADPAEGRAERTVLRLRGWLRSLKRGSYRHPIYMQNWSKRWVANVRDLEPAGLKLRRAGASFGDRPD